MAELFSLTGLWYPGQKVTFSRFELNQILSLYGTRVSSGEWRDYALDSTNDTAMFYIFKSSNDKPSFTIAKIAHKGFKRHAKFVVYVDNKTLKRGDTIIEVLQVFDDIDNNKKDKNKKDKKK